MYMYNDFKRYDLYAMDAKETSVAAPTQKGWSEMLGFGGGGKRREIH